MKEEILVKEEKCSAEGGDKSRNKRKNDKKKCVILWMKDFENKCLQFTKMNPLSAQYFHESVHI